MTEAEQGAALSPGALRSRQVDATLVGWMLVLTCLWGLNAVSVRALIAEMQPVLAAGLRGVLALPCLVLYGWLRGEPLVLRGWSLVHGGVAGGLFALEFVLIYSGARFTNSGHLVIFINTAPFFVAVGAHLMLASERLSLGRWLGLTLAFLGIVLLFSDDLYVRRQGFWRGDLLVMAGALAWALTTLYVKRFMTAGMNGFQLLYAQVLVSTPALLLAALVMEPLPWQWASPAAWGHLLFQAVAVVFLSYLAWFTLLRHYPASALQSFTFLSPIWGVLLGVALLGERLTLPTVAGMALVGAGLVLVNRPRRAAAPPA